MVDDEQPPRGMLANFLDSLACGFGSGVVWLIFLVCLDWLFPTVIPAFVKLIEALARGAVS